VLKNLSTIVQHRLRIV